MDFVLDYLADASRWSRGHLSEIALALVGCVLVLFGGQIKAFAEARVSSFSSALRVPAMALFCTLGAGAALIYATPLVLRGLEQLNNYSLAPALLAALVAIGVVADRK